MPGQLTETEINIRKQTLESDLENVKESIAKLDSEKVKKEHTEWHNIIAWNKFADFATQYLQKGQLVYLEGKLQTRSYKDKNDVKHWKTEIISNTITPLDWKQASKKNENKESMQDSNDKDDLFVCGHRHKQNCTPRINNKSFSEHKRPDNKYNIDFDTITTRNYYFLLCFYSDLR